MIILGFSIKTFLMDDLVVRGSSIKIFLGYSDRTFSGWSTRKVLALPRMD